MFKALLFSLLVLAVLLLSSCQFIHSFAGHDRFEIVGEILDLTPKSNTTQSDLGSEATESAAIEYPNVDVTMTREIAKADGSFKREVLAKGSFTDSKFTAVGRVQGDLQSEIRATIKVVINETEPISTEVVISAEKNVEFVLVTYIGKGNYELILKGSDLNSQDTAKRFRLSGDLRDQTALDLDSTNVQLSSTIYDSDGPRSVQLGSVMLQDGMFVIESDVEHLAVVDVQLRDGNTYKQAGAMVAEPGVEYEIRPVLDIGEFAVKALSEGAHSKLVDSWLWNDDWLDLMEQSWVAREAMMAEMRQAPPEEPVAMTNETAEPVEEDTSNSETEFARNNPAAPECQHVDLNAVILNLISEPSEDELPEFVKLATQAQEMTANIVKEIALTSENPWLSFAALNLDVFPYSDEWIKVEIEAYQRLSTMFNKEFAELNIDPLIEQKTHRIEVNENDLKLVPGQIVPTFQLASIDGEEVSLTNVLRNNDRILIDFWASWCGPCIASFPALKEMYESYHEQGFAIIGVSIDDTDEAWMQKSEELELPWVNLGENLGFDGPTPRKFGVQFIPKTYLLDSEGCIVQKDLETSQLKTVLTDRYGDVEEPTDTTDSTEI
ncbi:MAG: TlpA family protein disulfide reductase [Gammaproteobacteria bacterium]|nr:TlpA family protein disulfide reductase [Gammaproteobacteria bacterium]MYF53591.1 TlpA family protein disulfide reductase [Gammaproteobacteria bacterium]MYK43443.1 TlpA family protein disulfide reductase [Gammaproteobacteria bacterium]